jgi:predicted double-glycine peptidase
VLLAGLISLTFFCAALGFILDRAAPVVARVLGGAYLLVIAGMTYLLRHPAMMPEWMICRTMAQLQISWFMPFAAGLLAIGFSETFARKAAGKITQGDAIRSSVVLMFALVSISFVSIYMLMERTDFSYVKAEISPNSTIDENGVVRQSTDYTCGPSACATLLRTSGMAPNASEQRMAELCLTVRNGGSTSLGMAAGLKHVANEVGWRVRIENPEPADLPKLRMPFLAATRWHLLFDHAVVVVAYDQAKGYLVADPLSGQDWRPADKFEALFHRDAVVVYPNEANY